MTSADQENGEPFPSPQSKNFVEKLWSKFSDIAIMTRKLGQDDPRRIVHSLKVALAITLVSLFYYFQPLYDGFGVSAMWAVLTVVVVFEFFVGATLGKGLLRGLATFLAGALGVGAHRLASASGSLSEPILLGVFVFMIAAVVTFLRFFPRMKARYDYGLMIFILTFCLISVSGYRDDEVLEMAHERLSTVLIGGATAVTICIFICPVWAGDNLHKSVATNIENLGIFLQGFGSEYFKTPGQSKDWKKGSISQAYKSALNSKSSEESLSNFAKWEPPHGRFRYGHPWKQYLKIGGLTRQCAYRIEALNGYLNSEIQVPLEIQAKIQELCIKISLESGKTMNELAVAIKTMTKPTSADSQFANAKLACKDLKSSLTTGLWENVNLLEIIPVVTAASLLIEVVSCTEKMAEAVHELASLARFKSVDASLTQEEPNLVQQKSLQSHLSGKHLVITIQETSVE